MSTPIRLLLAALLIGTLYSAFFLLNNDSGTGVKTLRLGHSLDAEHVVHKSLLVFKQHLEKISAGEMNVEVYASEQLGTQRDLVELLQMGSLAMTKVSIGMLEAFVPEMQVFNLPYVFRDKTHYWNTLNSDVGQELLESTTAVGLRGLAYFDEGSRSFYTCKTAVTTPSDLKGLKIRTMKSKSAVALMTELGASATPISFGELYTSLQQGVVDGAENNAITFYKARHYEICKNFTVDEHNSIPGIIIFSEIIWKKLTLQQKVWVREAMAESVAFQKDQWIKDTDATYKALREAGINIIYPDKNQFKEMVENYKRSFDNTSIGELLKRIEAK